MNVATADAKEFEIEGQITKPNHVLINIGTVENTSVLLQLKRISPTDSMDMISRFSI